MIDGPFAETKEQLLGLYVVDCADEDAAIAVARDLRKVNPTAVYEIRPIALYLPGEPFPTTEAPGGTARATTLRAGVLPVRSTGESHSWQALQRRTSLPGRLRLRLRSHQTPAVSIAQDRGYEHEEDYRRDAARESFVSSKARPG